MLYHDGKVHSSLLDVWTLIKNAGLLKRRLIISTNIYSLTIARLSPAFKASDNTIAIAVPVMIDLHLMFIKCHNFFLDKEKNK